MRPKKILIFSLAYLPMKGGAELAVKEITDRINDVNFDLITLRFDKSWPTLERIGNINVYRIDCPKLFFSICAFLKARKMHPDLIWSIMANRAGFAALFFKFFHPQTKFLLTLQEGDPFNYPQKRMSVLWFFLKPLFKAIFTKADYIQAISNYLADWAKKMGAKKVEVIPNGVDIEKFRKSSLQKSLNPIRFANGAPPPTIFGRDFCYIITVSRLVKKNAVGDIIESLRYLPENIKLLILGDGPEREKLNFQVSIFNFQNRVKFLGEVKNDELPKYFEKADIFVRPSLSEGLGTAFLEAMAGGVPVIGTSVGGIPDFLKDGETGLFCEINNPQSIAEKVKLLLENDDLRNKIIANAKAMVKEKYDWNLISQKMKNIFEKLIYAQK